MAGVSGLDELEDLIGSAKSGLGLTSGLVFASSPLPDQLRIGDLRHVSHELLAEVILKEASDVRDTGTHRVAMSLIDRGSSSG
jgi:hypothetical protein